ncbi:MAG: hypothetical protein H7A46_23680, partial [Verrucomicrobiales bacterium]|nr:hypothetical protein [Verrucomicrobiales bacterium]
VTPEKFQAVEDVSAWNTGNFVKWDDAGQARFGRIEEIAEANADNTASVRIYQPKAEGGFEEGSEVASVPLASLQKPLPLWDRIWKIPAYGALVILILFALIFRERKEPPTETSAATEATI